MEHGSLLDIKKGLEILQQNIRTAPGNPGVYRMIDVNGNVLYIGKAKNIKKRIVSYSHLDKLPKRLQKMVSEIHKMEFIIVENEAKALLLENELIKELEPKYNILLKDDKTFPHLMIDVTSDFPALKKYRGKRLDKNKYFGPFASASAVNNVLDVVQKAFLLRSCRDGVFNNRSRPCLMHQIKRCSAPCVGCISQDDYRKLVNEAVEFLDGKNTKIQEELSKDMEAFSKSQDYERAMVLRDRIKALTSVQIGNNVEYAEIKSADFIAVAYKENIACIQVFFIRAGQNCGNIAYFPSQASDTTDDELLEAFVSNFYSAHIPPTEVVLSVELENSDFLSQAIKARINFYQKGNKAKIIETVKNNAVASLERKIAQSQSINVNLIEMQKVFELKRVPSKIEVYDNSHIQGSYAIGAYIVATKEGFDKKNYRKFNIKNLAITNDDFAMMKEVLTRRFLKMTEENRPDVILIDGGLGQLNAVHDALVEFDLSDIAIIAISKGKDRNSGKEFYHMKGKESFSLEFRSSLAFYMQNIRDESHRFAIGTHRQKRAKSIYKSSLDEIDGIGATRKRDLLNYFGSVQEISQISIKDLQKVSGISKKTAEKIYNYFHI